MLYGWPPPPPTSSPAWRAWSRSCTVRSVTRWWSSPSSCPASTVCVCCVPLKCWYKEVTLLQTFPRSPTRRHPHQIHARQDRHGDPCPGPLTAWNGSSEQVERTCWCYEYVCVWFSRWGHKVHVQRRPQKKQVYICMCWGGVCVLCELLPTFITITMFCVSA